MVPYLNTESTTKYNRNYGGFDCPYPRLVGRGTPIPVPLSNACKITNGGAEYVPKGLGRNHRRKKSHIGDTERREKIDR